MNVSPLQTDAHIAENCILLVPPGTMRTPVTVDSYPADVPVRKRIFFPIASHVILAVVDNSVVVHAADVVKVFDHRDLVPQEPAPKVPASESDGICTKASSS